MLKKSLVVFVSFIFLMFMFFGVGVVSAKAVDSNGDGKISFGEWIRGIFSGKVTEGTEEPTSSGNSYVISNCQDLQNMRNDLSGDYVINSPIDCSDTVNWNVDAQCSGYNDEASCGANDCVWAFQNEYCQNTACDSELSCDLSCGSNWVTEYACEDVYGFEPIGAEEAPFTGTLNAFNNSITGLFMKRTIDGTGFIGFTDGAVLTDVVLEDADLMDEDLFKSQLKEAADNFEIPELEIPTIEIPQLNVPEIGRK